MTAPLLRVSKYFWNTFVETNRHYCGLGRFLKKVASKSNDQKFCQGGGSTQLNNISFSYISSFYFIIHNLDKIFYKSLCVSEKSLKKLVLGCHFETDDFNILKL